MSKGWKGGSTTKWRKFRAAILERDKYTCTVNGPKCETRAALSGGTVDHIIPLSMGGEKYDPANARAACGPCNYGRRVAPVSGLPPKQISSW